jgi:hypothetical protein
MIFLISAGNFILHMAVSENYELHKDAYLYLNFADHPAWGYVTVPPFIMVISTLAVKWFGGSAFVIRFFPALAAAITTAYVGVLTKDLGGKRWSVLLATLTYALSPAFLSATSIFQPMAFNHMFWFMFYYLLVQMLRSKNLNYWYLIALVTGLGMLNKYTMIIPLITTVLGLLVSQRFSTLFCRQFWIGLVGIFALILPNVIWQFNHNWPLLYNIQALQGEHIVNIDAIHFSNMQFLMNSHGIIIWLVGLVSFFIYKPFRTYRPIGVSFLLMWALLLLVGARPYFMLGVYPILFVFGALYIVFKSRKAEWIRPVITSVVAVIALFLMPLSLPFFRIETMVGYGEVLKDMGIVSPFKWEDGDYHSLPENFAKMTGWREWAELTTDAYNSLSESEKENAIIFGDDYGKVGAVNHYNRDNDLPECYSFNGSYMFWAPEEISEESILIFLSAPPKELSEYFSSVEKFGELNVTHSYVDKAEIYILKNPRKEFTQRYQEFRVETLQPFFKEPL